MRKFIKAVHRKWVYSVVGLWTAIKEEKSIWTYLVLLPIVVGLGVWIELSNFEMALVILVVFLLICIEVLNTAIEAAVDTISFQYNVKVKKIKDIASGATLIITLGGAIVLLLIFIPQFQGTF